MDDTDDTNNRGGEEGLRIWYKELSNKQRTYNETEAIVVKHSRKDVRGKRGLGLGIRFEAQRLTSYSGLILFQHFFTRVGIKERLRGCFRHQGGRPIYGRHVMMLLLIVHLILGHRQLRDLAYYRDDEMVKRTLGLKRVPDVSTLSRWLSSADEVSVRKVRAESRNGVLERLAESGLSRVTLDFDGSVLSTKRHAEGTAVGFNKKKKGLRSYYPLFCTVAQTDQVLDVHHRPGNVHDSNGAETFMESCVEQVRTRLPRVQVETRIDSAFFNETIVQRLHRLGVEFTLSVPFERFAELKGLVQNRKRWRRMDSATDYFALRWKPKSWSRRCRFLCIRQKVHRQNKLPLQLDLFQPSELGCDFKVIVTNKRLRARRVVAFHEGRGSQEGIFAELKSHCQMDYIPVRTRAGNQLYMFSAIFAHNLTREFQMQLDPPARGTTAQRATRWCFREIETLRRNLIQRAGRIIRPADKPFLSMNHNETLEADFRAALATLNAHA